MWSRLALVLLALVTGSKVEASAYASSQHGVYSNASTAISGRIQGLGAGIRSGVLLTAGDQIGPSFDCATVTAPLPRLICANPRLSYVDLLMVQAYQTLRAQMDEAGKANVRSDAIDLHETVLSKCNIPDTGPLTPEIQQAADCVENYYLQQRNRWLSRLRPDAREEANRPLRRHIELQRVLQQLSLLSSLTTIDGVYGPDTRRAISEWQVSRGLTATGILSDQHAQLLERTPYERAAAQAAEQQRQDTAAKERERQRLEQEQQRLEQEKRDRDRAEVQQRERALFQSKWDSCKAFQAAACDAALQSSNLADWQRASLIEWRSAAVQFASDVQSCKSGSTPACEMATKSPAASPRDQVYLSQWAEANSLWNRAWRYVAGTASAIVAAIVNAITGTPLSTLIASVVALALAIALALVLVRNRGRPAGPMEAPQAPPRREPEPVRQTSAPRQPEAAEKASTPRGEGRRSRPQPVSAPESGAGLYAPHEIPQSLPVGARPRRHEISSGQKTAAVLLNVFFPGIGSLVAGRYVTAVCQMGLNLTAAVTGILFFPLGFIIWVGNWIWGVTVAASAPTQPMQVVVQHSPMPGRL